MEMGGTKRPLDSESEGLPQAKRAADEMKTDDDGQLPADDGASEVASATAVSSSSSSATTARESTASAGASNGYSASPGEIGTENPTGISAGKASNGKAKGKAKAPAPAPAPASAASKDKGGKGTKRKPAGEEAAGPSAAATVATAGKSRGRGPNGKAAATSPAEAPSSKTGAEPPPITAAAAAAASAAMAGGSGRRMTRGVVPALKAELEVQMAHAPVAPMEGWHELGAGAADAGPRITTWEGWESRLKEERVPKYVVADLWALIDSFIAEKTAEATRPLETLATIGLPAFDRAAFEKAAGLTALGARTATSHGAGASSSADSAGASSASSSSAAAAGAAAPAAAAAAAAAASSASAAPSAAATALTASAPAAIGDGEPSAAISAKEMEDFLLHGCSATSLGCSATAAAAPKPAAATRPAAAEPAAAAEPSAETSAAAAARPPPACAMTAGNGHGPSGGVAPSAGPSLGRPLAAPSAASASASASASEGADACTEGAADGADACTEDARDLRDRLRRLVPLARMPLSFGQLYYVLLGMHVGHKNKIAPSTVLPDGQPRSKATLMRTNLAHRSLAAAEALYSRLNEAFLEQCARTARALRLDVPIGGGAIALRKALKGVLETAECVIAPSHRPPPPPLAALRPAAPWPPTAHRLAIPSPPPRRAPPLRAGTRSTR